MAEKHSVCSAKHAGLLSTRLRKLIHNPDKILGKMISNGQTVLDVGCGPGFFTLPMATLVGDQGKVIAADLQQEMLDRLRIRAQREKLESRIELHKCLSDKIGVDRPVDFVLAFYVVHEVPNAEAFLREIHDLLKPGGTLLLSEPKFHVPATDFLTTIETARKIGFEIIDEPRIALSQSALLKRK